MRKSRFTEEQIVGIVREGEAGAKVVEICRRHGISQVTYHRWKQKYGGMTVPETTPRELLQFDGHQGGARVDSGCRLEAVRERCSQLGVLPALQAGYSAEKRARELITHRRFARTAQLDGVREHSPLLAIDIDD